MATATPILRIFDYHKAIEFYRDWLGFSVDWEHRFGENSPVYMGISLQGIELHLSEHHGDSTPGARVYISDFKDLSEYHKSLLEKNYTYNRPGISREEWNPKNLCMEAIDPFGNRLTFTGEG
jgi:catechol 2,3-dioxygenase-like lactoylglutathione lyase family enzyme